MQGKAVTLNLPVRLRRVSGSHWETGAKDRKTMLDYGMLNPPRRISMTGKELEDAETSTA